MSKKDCTIRHCYKLIKQPRFKIWRRVMTSGNGITNTEIEKSFINETNDDLKINFIGVSSSDSITKYIKS